MNELQTISYYYDSQVGWIYTGNDTNGQDWVCVSGVWSKISAPLSFTALQQSFATQTGS